MEDFLKIIDIEWIENDYYSYFRQICDIIKCFALISYPIRLSYSSTIYFYINLQ
jgi:hypothetical protein